MVNATWLLRQAYAAAVREERREVTGSLLSALSTGWCGRYVLGPAVVRRSSTTSLYGAGVGGREASISRVMNGNGD